MRKAIADSLEAYMLTKPKEKKFRGHYARNFFIRKRSNDQLVLSFASVPRCTEIIALLRQHQGELV